MVGHRALRRYLRGGSTTALRKWDRVKETTPSSPTARQAMAALVPVHHGEVLLEESLRPLEVSQSRLAAAIGVPPSGLAG